MCIYIYIHIDIVVYVYKPEAVVGADPADERVRPRLASSNTFH